MPKQISSTLDKKISATMRDYLGDIYRLGQGQAWVSTTALAEQLNVSGPATVRMVRRLQKYGLVDHQPYRGVKLTDQGQIVALLNIRRHRLVERFLVDMLEFPWYDVHDDADDLQKGINQRIEDRMDELLDYPTTCPHGDPIPSREGVMPEIGDKPMNVVPVGFVGQISRVKTHDPEKLKYLSEIGVVPGVPFKLVNRAPFNGPIRLKLARHNEQIIGQELAAALWVLKSQSEKSPSENPSENDYKKFEKF